MPANPFIQLVFDLFILSAIIITAYTCNFYYLAILSKRPLTRRPGEPGWTPSVTIQLPIYNEKYVARRLVEAVCALDYPRDRMRIMVLDDSDDDTVEVLGRIVAEYKGRGFDIEHVRRGTRSGYKAGALKHAMATTDTELVAIFDADFIPPSWFLRRAIPHIASPEVGLVQCRWGHVNEDYSALTRAQALALDMHFLVEQKAKSDSHLFMNFNGTAGIWRRDCITDSGGWNEGTLVEDLDLSYRAQMGGWKCVFLPDIVVNAELPVQMNAAKRQQFRWAKGSIQCAVKLLSKIATRPGLALEARIQAFIQLTRHVVYPLMLVQFLALPILLVSEVNLYVVSLVPALTIAAYLAMGPGAFMMIMQRMYGRSWRSRAWILPALLIYNAGMSVNNTVAVFDAVFGKKNEFLRTPKYGITSRAEDWRGKAYNLPFTRTTLLEAFFGVYGVIAVFAAIFSANPVFVPIIAIQTAGFFYIASMSVSHTRFKRDKSGAPGPGGMASAAYRLALAGIAGIIIFGGYMAISGYDSDIYPLDRMRGHMDGIIGSSDPATILQHLDAVRDDLGPVLEKIPEGTGPGGEATRNPVWFFPTPSTDFVRIEGDVEGMARDVRAAASLSRDDAAYHTAMIDASARAVLLRENIMDATPYMYVSIANIIFGTVWIAAILGIFAALKRKKAQIEQAGV
ncbi:Glycosyl transferase family 2 [Nitrosopumilaceae archaeon]|nr:Glycosyl transferase family 2 [Nitrosopumilaceae archaeon]